MQPLKIGSRESALALYQARKAQVLLKNNGIESEIIRISSEGDSDLETPLYEMGIQGIFTKSLDMALLQNKIDIAIHSAKDIPTILAKGLCIGAVLERGPVTDTIVKRNSSTFDYENICQIATGSLRRKMQWLHRYPHHEIHNLRGNIQTRLSKLENGNWDGAIFASAALHRLNINSDHAEILNWMLPSPAQGAIAIVCRETDPKILEILKSLNHEMSWLSIRAERQFLAALQGGCAVPIAALAEIKDGKLNFRGNIVSLDAKQKIEIEMEFDSEEENAGNIAAEEIIKKGAEPIVKSFRK